MIGADVSENNTEKAVDGAEWIGPVRHSGIEVFTSPEGGGAYRAVSNGTLRVSREAQAIPVWGRRTFGPSPILFVWEFDRIPR